MNHKEFWSLIDEVNREAESWNRDSILLTTQEKLLQFSQQEIIGFHITQREPDGALRCVFPKKWLTLVLREPISEAERQRRSERGKANNMAALLRQQRR